MSKIALHDVSCSYPSLLFEGVNLRIEDREKIGLVGNNGAGKSTLLACLIGRADITKGSISITKGLKFAIVEQHTPPSIVELTFRQSVSQALPTDELDSREWQVDYLLDTLEIPNDIRRKKIAQLSGGWQRFAMLAQAWISEPDFLILDEPTNSLDLQKIVLLERWINSVGYATPMLIVSHDRRFLNHTTNQTLFLRKRDSRLYAYPYSRTVQILAADDAALEQKKIRETQKIERLRRSAHHLKQIGTNKHSDAALKRSIQMTKRIALMENSMPITHKEVQRDIKLSNCGTHAQLLLQLLDVSIYSPASEILLKIKKMDVRRGDRIVVLGKNGVGKSQFIHTIYAAIMNREQAKSAGIHCAPSVLPAYMDQTLSALPKRLTLRQYLSEKFHLDENSITGWLVAAGFAVGKRDQKIARLSAGQQVRLLLLALRLAKPNFYILDEPTNHIDITGQEQLEEEIIAHGATCLFVSHDREIRRPGPHSTRQALRYNSWLSVAVSGFKQSSPLFPPQLTEHSRRYHQDTRG